MKNRKLKFIVLLMLLPMGLSAQENSLADTAALKSVDGIVQEVLRLSSGEKGESRNWDAFRNLFLPTARFTVLNHDSSFPEPAETVSLEEFIELMHDEYYEEGYIEFELGKVVDEYNGIAQVFQAVYQKDSEGYEGRSMNSYQLIYVQDR